MTENEYYTVWVDGTPRPQPRSRARTVGMAHKIHIYTPHKDPVTQWKRSITWGWKQRHPEPLAGPLSLGMYFFFPRPKRLMKKGSPTYSLPHTGVPDLDNLAKAVMDALKFVAWQDDRQVCEVTMAKSYVVLGDTPGVHISLARIDY